MCILICMRGKRIKLVSEEGEAVYHCTTRTVNGERLFEDVDREQLRRQIWVVADYCGVQVLTYAILSNHFHVLVRVPKKEPVNDAELLRRFEVLYPKPTKYQTARLDVIKAQLASNGPDAVKWRAQQLRQMGDVSAYMKLVKQRFSIGFNRRHERYGTLWAERFKSVLLDPSRALQITAAYVDLNCVRAGLADDPKEYRFCGYAEAVAGAHRAREGLAFVGGEPWETYAARYRCRLFATGANPLQARRKISEKAFEDVLQKEGELGAMENLRCRLRFLSDSGILGSEAFLLEMRRRCRLDPKRDPRPIADRFHVPGLHSFKWSRAGTGAG